MRAVPRALLALVLVSCTSDRLSGPEALAGRATAVAAPRPPHISEIHYDNSGTDVDERIEVTGPAGMDLTGWSIVRYNGSNNKVYTSPAPLNGLGGAIPATCGAEGVQVVRYPQDGLQNGAPDGVALVDNTGRVVEFLSYEGPMTAADGPALGMAATQIGTQNGTPIGQSLQRNGLGGWTIAESNFGACNDQPPPPYDGPTTVVINELMGAPLAAESESWGEWFEVYNYGTEPVNLGGWKIRSARDAEHTIAGNVIVAPGGYAVLGRATDQTKNGDVAANYNYFTGGTTIWLDANDWLVLRTPTSVTVDSTAWTSLPIGATRALRDASVDNANADGANWGYSTTTFGSGDYGTPGAFNGTLSETAPAVPTGVVRITFTGRDAVSDPPLPVGFEDQLFASAFDAAKQRVTTTLTWSSATPELASVDQDGVVHALGAGVALIRATAEDGRSAVYRVPTRVGVASTTASYVGNAEFGIPTDADPSDDFLITRAEFTSSYSSTRNTPNWVSYDLEATHFGPEDRCDCFTADPSLPSSFTHLTTADYTGAGAAAGYGIDRGHLMRSSDRTAASLDNAESFYLSNIIPQSADQNQGPWNNLEGVLNARARLGTDEIYIIAGVAGSKGTLKDEGKVVIPQSVWKIAVIMPRDQGVRNVDSPDDFELIVVDMPNVPGIRNADWKSYATTVDALEAKTGYDLLALLPDHVEWLIEAGFTKPSDATAPQLLTLLTNGVQDLVAKGTISEGNGTSLLAKLAHAQESLSGNNSDHSLLNSFENEVDAMVRSGRLASATGESLTTFAGWVANAAR